MITALLHYRLARSLSSVSAILYTLEGLGWLCFHLSNQAYSYQVSVNYISFFIFLTILSTSSFAVSHYSIQNSKHWLLCTPPRLMLVFTSTSLLNVKILDFRRRGQASHRFSQRCYTPAMENAKREASMDRMLDCS